MDSVAKQQYGKGEKLEKKQGRKGACVTTTYNYY